MTKNLSKKTILIVDDDPSSLILYTEILLSTGAVVLCANDGEMTLLILSQQTIDLVLLDLKLPDMSGFSILQEIRQKYKQVKVMAQTAFAMDINRECLEAGFDDCITKPVEMDRLLVKISALLLQ